MSFFTLLYGVIAALALAYYELKYYDQTLDNIDTDTIQNIVITIKASISFTTILSIALSLYYHHNELELFKFDNTLSCNKIWLFFHNQTQVAMIVLEILIILVHPLYWIWGLVESC